MLDGGAVDIGSAEADVGFDCAGEKEWILKHDAELPPQILQFDGANVLAVKENLTALNVVKAKQQGNQSGLARARVADDGDGLPRLHSEGDIAQDPIFVGGLGDIVHFRVCTYKP